MKYKVFFKDNYIGETESYYTALDMIYLHKISCDIQTYKFYKIYIELINIKLDLMCEYEKRVGISNE